MKSALNGPITDSYVFHDWNKIDDLLPYMSAEWKEVLLRPSDLMGPADPRAAAMYGNPLGEVAPESRPATCRPGADYGLLTEQVTRGGNVDRVVLGLDDGAYVGSIGSHHLARALARAINDWTNDEWLARDSRLHGVIALPGQVPSDAAAEIRRAGANERMVAIALGSNTLARPFGHEIYHPIYEAADELALPLILQIGSDAVPGQATPPVGGGVVGTVSEFRALSNHSHMSHVMSMIFRGVFTRFPNLKVLLVGGGAAWVPGFLWRLDYWYKINQPETPWVNELPSEIFTKHCRVGTYQLEKPSQQERLANALGTVPEMPNLLIYMSCYPKADSELAAGITSRLPESWHEKVLNTNADGFFRWAAARADRPVSGSSTLSVGG